MPAPSSAIEIRGAGSGLLDDGLALSARGGGPSETLQWRARFRDDDGRVWRSSGDSAPQLARAWQPAKTTTGPLPALQSLRPLRIDVHVEAVDGRSATRTVTRLLVAEGVRIRRWRDAELNATLCLPDGAPCATVLLDATPGPRHAAAAALAAPLLASRGVLALALPAPRGTAPPDTLVATAVERLAAVPTGGLNVVVLTVQDPLDAMPAAAGDVVVLPPGAGVRDEEDDVATGREAAWDALIARLGAQPRETR